MAVTVLTFDEVLTSVSSWPESDQAMLIDLLAKRRAAAWRRQIARLARKSARDLAAGKLKPMKADEAADRLGQIWHESNP